MHLRVLRTIGMLIAAIGISAAAAVAAETADQSAKSATGDFAHPTKAGIEFFEKKIRPVLVQKCYQCHAASAASVKGGLRLDTREAMHKGGESGAVIVPGDSESSLLMEALRFEGLEMPPTGKLSDEQIADFAKWIDMGAPDPRNNAVAAKKGLSLADARQFWAFKQPIKHAPPTVKDTGWAATDIDRFVLAAMEQKGLTPAAEADPATLCRRLYIDLTGLPPSPTDLEDFIRGYTTGDRVKVYAALVDKLLASPQFGERWGRHWLDIARYGESTGKERNVPYTHAWKYRDWVVDAFNADKPYTKFILEQIAGDLLPAANSEQKNAQAIGTGFLALGPKSINERNAEQFLMDVVDEQIDVTTRAFLATTVGCARCHDHKFDPIPQTDYYALAGIFRSTDTLAGVSGRSKNGANRDYSGALMPLADTSSAAAKPAANDPLASLSNSDREEFEKIAKRVAARKAELEQIIKDGKQGNAKAKKETKKQYQTVTQQIARDEKKLEELRGGSSSSGSVAASDFAMGVRDVAKPADTELRVRGEPDDRGAVVPRGFVSVLNSSLSPKVNMQQSGRLELAQWIAGRDNPLTARVAVNRIWYHLFGRGLVETVDNFGALGEEPTHPQLLDYLAVRFMDEGWSTKTAIRNIVLSQAYRMASDHDAADYAKDPGNIYLWRMNRRRLDAEAIRDSMLAVSGTLDLTRPEASPVAKLSASNEVGRRGPLELDDASVARHRSMYLPLMRNAVPEVLSVFDVADPSLVVGQRESTTVATQALFMMNSPFALEHATAAAERLLTQVPSDEALRVEAAYRTILSRPATADERARGVKFVHDYLNAAAAEGTAEKNREADAWAALCQTLFASAEFRYLY